MAVFDQSMAVFLTVSIYHSNQKLFSQCLSTVHGSGIQCMWLHACMLYIISDKSMAVFPMEAFHCSQKLVSQCLTVARAVKFSDKSMAGVRQRHTVSHVLTF